MTQAISAGSSLPDAIATANDARPFIAAHRDLDRHFARRGHGAEFEMEAGWILRELPNDASRVLDIGCGIGALFPRIGPSRVVGIDYAYAGLRRTHERFPASRLACGDGMALPFAEGSFDAITVQHVIEHLPDANLACAEWRRVLRPNGRIIIVTPNAEFSDPTVFDDPSHTQIFDRNMLKQLVENGGLVVERMLTLGLPWVRRYRALPGGWRLRRLLLGKAEWLARLPTLRWSGQSLCCVAHRSDC